MADDAMTDGVTAYTSTFHEANVRTQVISRVTADPTVTEGRVIARTDLKRLRVATAAAYVDLASWGTVSTWTPASVAQSAALTYTVNIAEYERRGMFIDYELDISITSTGTAANALRVGLPSGIEFGSTGSGCKGTALYYDSNVSAYYHLVVRRQAAGVIDFWGDGSTTGAFGVSPAVTAASGDVLQARFTVRI